MVKASSKMIMTIEDDDHVAQHEMESDGEDMNITQDFSFSLDDSKIQKLSQASTRNRNAAVSVWNFDDVKRMMSSDNKVARTSVDDVIARRLKLNKDQPSKVAEEATVEVAESEDEDDIEEHVAGNDSDDESINESGSEHSEMALEEGSQASRDDTEDASEHAEDASDASDSEDEEEAKILEMSADEASESEAEEDRVMEKRKSEYFEMPDVDAEDHHDVQSFHEMNLSRQLLKALTDLGFSKPTKIQAMTIPVALAGKDICGAASTGSGKTAAFLLPIFERLLYRPKAIAASRVLILTPTRELAAQCHSVGVQLAKYTDISLCLCVGGTSNQRQEAELRRHPDIIIATPGRLIDHIKNSSSFGLDSIEILVMDEADRMLEEGFQAELTEIIKDCPRSRQTLLFSATMTDNVTQLIRLSLNRPVKLFIDATRSIARNIEQEFIRIRVNGMSGKELENAERVQREAILLALCMRTYTKRAIIFFPSKVQCHRMKVMFSLNDLKAAELHGGLTQLQRLEALEKFRDGDVEFLLATDLAARGLDIVGIETVINFHMPLLYDRYVHRVGRTARHLATGKAVTLVGEKERKMVKIVLKNLRKGQVVKQRVIPAKTILRAKKRIVKLEPVFEQIMADETSEKAIYAAEVDLKRAENMLTHSDQIYARPAKQWFQTEKEKVQEKKRLRDVDKQTTQEAHGDSGEFAKSIYEEELKKEMAKTPKRGAMDGLSRKQKRRKMLDAELGQPPEKTAIAQKVYAKHAKKVARRDDGEGKSSERQQPRKGSSKKSTTKRGFESEIGDLSKRGIMGGKMGRKVDDVKKSKKGGKMASKSKSKSGSKKKFTKRR